MEIWWEWNDLHVKDNFGKIKVYHNSYISSIIFEGLDYSSSEDCMIKMTTRYEKHNNKVH